MFLLRENKLYGLNTRQEFKNDLIFDTLTLKQIREAMALSSQACCDKLEEEILAAGKPGQDNYTAIALKYHGKNEEES